MDALFILTPQPAVTPTQLPVTSPLADFHATITDGFRDDKYSYSTPTDTRTGKKNDCTPAFYGLNPLQTESIALCWVTVLQPVWQTTVIKAN